MDSRPSPPEADAAPLRGTEQVAAGLHARRVPILATPRLRPLAGIGDTGRAARRFSAMTNLSGYARRAMENQRRGLDVGGLLVRPPDYWAGHRDEDLGGTGSRHTTGDAALDRLIARRAAQRKDFSAPLRLQRGLPSTVHRRSHSLAGPMTAPGGMARRLQPASVVPVPNPANSPQAAAPREPRSRPARPAGSRGDAPRPARRAGTNPAVRSSSTATVDAPGRQRSATTVVAPPGSPGDIARHAAASAPAAPVGRQGPASAPPVGQPGSSAPAVGPAGTSATDGGQLGTSAPTSARHAGTPTSVARQPAASTPAGPHEAPGARSAAPSTDTPAVVGAAPDVARRSAAPSELDPRAGGDPIAWVTAAGPTAAPGEAAGRWSAEEPEGGDRWDLDGDALAWPGDEPEVAAGRGAPMAGRSIGRQVAVRPLLAGWRSPTAWRSIAAAPGVRLLPVGAAGLNRSSSMTSAGDALDAPAGSWSDVVRRAAAESERGPGMVRGLPVGGPAVVVRDGTGGNDVQRRVGAGAPSTTRPSTLVDPGATAPRRAGAAPAAAGIAPPPAASPQAARRAGTAAAPDVEPSRAVGSSTAPDARRSRTAPAERESSASGAQQARTGGTSSPSAAPRQQVGSSSPADVQRAAVGSSLVAAGASASGDSPGRTASWSSLPLGAKGSAQVLVRRRVASSPAGVAGVELSAWVPAPGTARLAPDPTGRGRDATAPDWSAPGERLADARRPGHWFGRAAMSGPDVVRRVPLGPLGPVRWSARADEPVVARAVAGGPSSWSASVAAASAAMAGAVPVGGDAVRPPASGRLTLVRGGQVDGSDLPVASIQRSASHPAASRLRLVPAVPGAAAPGARPADRQAAVATGSSPTSSSSSSPSSSAASAAPSSAPAPLPAGTASDAYVGRAPVGAAPFVGVPGAVAAHGLPSANAPLVGITASGGAAGHPGSPGQLARLAHGQVVTRRPLPEAAPAALVLGRSDTTAPAPATSDRAGLPASLPAGRPGRPARPMTARPGLPATPAAAIRRHAAAEVQASVTTATPTWSERVGRAATRSGVYASGPTAVLGSSTVASLRRLPVAPMAFVAAVTDPAAPGHEGDRSGGVAQRRGSLASSATPGTSTASGGPGPGAGSAAPWSSTVAAAWGSTGTSTVPGASAARAMREVPSGGWADAGAGSAPGTSVIHRSRTPHGVTATVARTRATHPGSAPTVADRWRAADVPSRALPGRAPGGLRPLVAPPVGAAGAPGAAGTPSWSARVAAMATGGTQPGAAGLVARRQAAAAAPSAAGTPSWSARVAAMADGHPGSAPVEVRSMRASAPGAAGLFETVLRSSDLPVRPVALPVRFRPLAERIVGRLPVQIATGVPSRRALAAVGTSAATTGSVIHLPAPPDSSARMAGILAHELTHVAAASPVARFHGGRPSIEETRANQVERIVARAARTTGLGRGPNVVGTRDLPVAGFVGTRGATAGPSAPASAGHDAGGSGVSADDMVARLTGGGSASGSSVQRKAAPPPPPAPDVDLPDVDVAPDPPGVLERGHESTDDTPVLSEQAMDAIVQALEARLLESIERRGGLWRGGF